MKALFVTGQPSCGKTTLVQHLVHKARQLSPSLPITGFITAEVLTGKQAGTREGFDAVSVSDPSVRGPLARKSLRSKWKTGAYGVDVPGFEKVALPLLEVQSASSRRRPTRRPPRGGQRVASKSLVVIDEIGRMEMHSEAFTSKVKELFANDSVLLLGSLAAPRYGHVVPLAERIKKRQDVRTHHLKASTRADVRENMEAELESLLLGSAASKKGGRSRAAPASNSTPQKRRKTK